MGAEATKSAIRFQIVLLYEQINAHIEEQLV